MRFTDGEQACSDRAQQSVADEVAATVVDGLEAVEVEIEQRTRSLRRANRAAERPQRVLETAAVRQSGQAVVTRQEGDAGLRLTALGGVRAHAAIARERSLRVEDGLAVERDPARAGRGTEPDGAIAERRARRDRRGDGLGVRAVAVRVGERAQKLGQRPVAQPGDLDAEQGGDSGAGLPKAPDRVGFPEPVARALGEILEEEPDGLALRLHHDAVAEALVGVPAHPTRAHEDEGRVQRQQHGDVLADRALATGEPDEDAGHHRRHSQECQGEDRACHVGVRDQGGADGPDHDPVGIVDRGQQDRRHAGPGETAAEREAVKDGEGLPGDRSVAEAAAIAAHRDHSHRAQRRHRHRETGQVSVRDDAPEDGGQREHDGGLRHRRVSTELQRLGEHRGAHRLAQARVLVGQVHRVVDAHRQDDLTHGRARSRTSNRRRR